MTPGGGPYYIWWATVPGTASPFPMGVYSSPPPDELAQVHSAQIEKSNASEAARWITHRLNEAAEVYKKIPVP